ncbi:MULTISPECIES: 30S ribosomal protein S20 [unclassified Fusibacter]|uniref:30S ribosomal protein S20 n=1 Tax=unclassified Fusibacter TaxID=2624464 RepID=UPI0010120964|nr:30S ribosomal protein S20 [Fusibacter sp. A1]MCK8058011.1 30S ribosomal protein S20 [Fusibacter sp. A2]NPE20593.1 30S ribosomal protein S20 [Fusibacter sp. A1]RXV62800.1 30S ribosomal protein S20 [Fusibacter sp. A1]
MANIKSAKKRISVIATKTARNKSRKSAMRTAIKRVNEAVESGDKALAAERLQKATKTISMTATKGTIHKATASRLVSRLAKRVNALG